MFSSLSIAQAATFTVTNLNDEGGGSLRQAVSDANATPGADTIVFKAGLTGVILLTGEILITDSLTINGPGAKALALDGKGASRIFHTPTTMGSKALTINGLTLKNGKARNGGAILSEGSLLTVNASVLSGNSSDVGGGAIAASGGTVTVEQQHSD